MSKTKKANKVFMNVGIDLSGKPPETCYVGLVRLNMMNQDEIIEEFQKTYPDIWQLKGRNLTHDQLLTVVEFFNKRNVRMATIKYTSNDWMSLTKHYPKKGFVAPKMLGMLYFTVLRRVVNRKMKVSVITCTETGINISKVHETCNKVAKINHFTFHFSHGSEKFHPIIKIADYIASAGRNVKEIKLKEFSNFIIENRKNIPKYIYKKIYR